MSKDKPYRFASILVVTLLIGISLGSLIVADTPDGFPTVLEPGSQVQDAKYLVFPDGSDYYARNGESGEIEFSDTNAAIVINSAIEALTSGRTWLETVKLRGSFELSATVTLTNFTVLDMTGAKMFLGVGIEVPLIRNDKPTTGNQNIIIKGGQLVGNQPTQAGTGGSGIYFTRVVNCQILNVNISQCDLDAVYLERSKRCLVFGCQIVNCAEGILFANDCWDNIASNNILRNMMEQDGLEVSGVSAQSGRNSFIDNTVIGPTPGNTGVDIFQNAINTVIEGNTFVSTGGLSVGGASTSWCNSTVVRGNYVTDPQGSATYGVQIHKASYCVVSSNIIQNMNGTGILMTSSSSRNIISDNLVQNAGKATGGAAGINVAGGHNNTIVGNFIYDVGQICLGITASDCIVSSNIVSTPGAPAPYGISINGKRNIVTANHCEGGGRGIIVYGYGNLVEGNDVRNNSYSAKIATDGYSTIRYNLGYLTEIKGNRSITGAVNSVTFAHGLVSTPILILVTPTNIGCGNFVSTTTATQITITFENQPGASTWYFHWYAQTW